MADNPSRPSSDHAAMQSDWAMLRAVMGGTSAMRAANETYLPKWPSEPQEAYDTRLERSVFTNYFEDAVRNLVSKPFRKPVVLRDGASPRMMELVDDVDLQGNNLDVFGRTVLEDGVVAGLSHILVDFPRTPQGEGVTLADQKADAVRPYMVHVRAENLLALYTRVVGGLRHITEARILEEAIEVEDFEERVIRRVRVWRPGEVTLYREDEGKWTLEEQFPVTMPVVPLVTIWCGRQTGSMTVKSIFLDLAYKNIEHWQSASDQRNILGFARFPMLAVSGAGAKSEGSDEVVIGPRQLLTTDDVQGRWYYVEPEGNAIESGARDLAALEEHMRVQGLQPMLPNSTGSITATERALDESRANTAVDALALGLEDGLDRAFALMAQWLGEEPSAHVEVNRDYGVSLKNASEISELIKSRMAGDISRETLWEELKRRGVLSNEFDPDLEAGRLDGEAPFGIDDASYENDAMSTATRN